VAHRRRLAAGTPADRAAALLDRYPDLDLLPGCDWDGLGVTTVFGLLYGAASRHFANLQLAALAGIVSSEGVSRAYIVDADHCVRTVLSLMQKGYRITTPHDITLDMWEEWGCDTDRMRSLTNQIAKYAAAVNYHTPAYVERLSEQDQGPRSPPTAAATAPPIPRSLRPDGRAPCRTATQAQGQDGRPQ
jgi:hypothetical protein